MRAGKRGRARGWWWCVWWKKGRKGTRRNAETPFVESSKRPSSSLVNPLHLQTLSSLSERDLNFSQSCQSLSKISLVMWGPRHLVSTSFLTLILTYRESPHLRNQLGHSSSNRVPQTFPPHLNLLIHSAASQTSLAISPRLPPRLSSSPPFP